MIYYTIKYPGGRVVSGDFDPDTGDPLARLQHHLRHTHGIEAEKCAISMGRCAVSGHHVACVVVRELAKRKAKA
jgi:hypothetical protein